MSVVFREHTEEDFFDNEELLELQGYLHVVFKSDVEQPLTPQAIPRNDLRTPYGRS